jgi:hypothetical protein
MPIRSEIGSGERCYKNLLTEFKDVRYFSACNFFNGRVAPHYDKLKIFRLFA